MDVGFNDQRGMLTWQLPQQINELVSRASQDQQKRVIDFLNQSLSVMAMALLQGFGNQRLGQHLEATMAILADLTALAQAQEQQAQQQNG